MGDGIISLPEVDKGKFAGNHHFFQVIVVSAKIPAAQWSQLFFWQPKCWGRTRQTSVGWKQRSKLDCYLLQLLISHCVESGGGRILPNLEVWYPNILPVKPMRMLKQTITYPNAWLKGLIGLSKSMFLATWFHPKMRIRVPSGVREFRRTGQVAALRVIADFWGDHRSNSSGWSNIIIQPDQCTSIHMSTQHLPGKNCRNPADDTPGNPDAKLHLPVKSEKSTYGRRIPITAR